MKVLVDGNDANTEQSAWASINNGPFYVAKTPNTIEVSAQNKVSEGFDLEGIFLSGGGKYDQLQSDGSSKATVSITDLVTAKPTAIEFAFEVRYKHHNYKVDLDEKSRDFNNTNHVNTTSADRTQPWAGDVIKVTPNKNRPGYNFDNVTVSPSATVTEDGDGYKFTMPASDVTVKANYTAKEYNAVVNTYIDGVKSSETWGSVTGSDFTVDGKNSAITINAPKQTGYTVEHFFANDHELTTGITTAGNGNKTCVLTLTEDNITTYRNADDKTITIDVYYSHEKYAIYKLDDASYFENMTAPQTTEAGVGKYYYGDKITFNVKDRKPGYDLESVTSPDVTIDKVGDEYSFDMPAKDVTITAKYQPNTFHITALDDYVKFGDLQNLTTADVTYENPEVKIAVTSKEGYTHTGFQVFDKASDGSQIGSDLSEAITSLNITNFGKDIWVKAIFTANDYNIVTDGIATCDKSSANFKDKITFKVPASPLGYDFTKVVVMRDDKSTEVFSSTAWKSDDYEFDMPASNVHIIVTRTAKKYPVTYNGEYEKSGKAEVTIDDDIVFKPSNKLSEGYEVKSIKLTVVKDGGNVDKPITLKTDNTEYELDVNTYLTENPTATAFIVDVVHDLKDFEIVCDDNSQAKDGKKFAHINEEVTISASKRDGYDIQRIEVRKSNNDWVGDVADKYEYTFTMPASDVKVATFYNMKYYTIEVKEGSDYINNITSYSLSDASPNTTITYNKVKGKRISKVYIKKVSEIGTSDEKKYDVTFDDVDYKSGVSIQQYWDNIYLYVEYEDVVYTISSDKYTTVTNTVTSESREVGDVKAKYLQKISVAIKDRTVEGYDFEKATYDGEEGKSTICEGTVFTGTFDMPAKNVEISTIYKPIDYPVTYKSYLIINKGDVPMDVTNSMALITGIPTASVEKGVTYNLGTKPGYAATSLTINGDEITSYTGYYDISKPEVLAKVQAKNGIEVIVTFEVQDYNIIAKSGVKNVKDKDGNTATTARYMDEITFEVEERDGYTIESVVVKGNTTNDILTKKDDKYAFKMPSEHVELVANYEYIAKTIEYQVVVDGEAVSDADAYYSYQNSKAKVNIDDMIMFGAKTIDGKRLTGVTVGGDNFYDGSSSYVAAAKKYVLANNTTIIIKLTYTKLLTVTTDANVSVDKNAVLPGQTVNYTVAQKPGYTIKEVSVSPADGAEGLTDKTAASGTLTVKKDIELSVEYTAEEFDVVSADGFCKTCPTTAKTDDNVELEFEDRTADGYILQKATYNGKPLTLSGFKASFTMPAEDVIIVAHYDAKEYNVAVATTPDGFGSITADKAKATVTDVISFEITPSTDKQVKTVEVIYGTDQTDDITANVSDNKGVAYMYKYKSDITIKVTFENVPGYAIEKSPEDYITTKIGDAVATSALPGKTVSVEFTNRTADGYDLESATYNGRKLKISNYKSSFKMPAEDVYVEANYALHKYAVNTATNVSADKKTATVNDRVSFTIQNIPDAEEIENVVVTDAASNEHKLDADIRVIDMADYKSDITISYTTKAKEFNIHCDEYATAYIGSDAAKKATSGTEITVKFGSAPEGYVISGIKVYGDKKSASEGKATFTMQAKDADVETILELKKASVVYDPADDFTKKDIISVTINDYIIFAVENKENASTKQKIKSITVNDDPITVAGYSYVVPAAKYVKASDKITVKVDYEDIAPEAFAIVNPDGFATAKASASESADPITKANEGSKVYVFFQNRETEGYELKAATMNGNPLTINSYKSDFVMPSQTAIIIVEYQPKSYIVSVEAEPSDAGAISASKTSATVSDMVSFIVTPADGKELDKVEVLYGAEYAKKEEVTDRVYNGRGILYMYEYLSNIKIKATFKNVPGYAIEKSDADITVTVDGETATSATAGKTVSVKFASREGYDLKSATYNDRKLKVSDNAASFKMPAEDVYIEANYVEHAYTVTAGTYIKTDKKTATINDRVTFYLSGVPDDKTATVVIEKHSTGTKFNFTDLSGNTGIVDMGEIKSDITISAELTDKVFNINCDQYAKAYVSDAEVTTAKNNTAITVKFSSIPAGYEVAGIKVYGVRTDVSSDGTATFTMQAKDADVETILELKSKEIVYKPIDGTNYFAKTGVTTATINDYIIFEAQNRESEGLKLKGVTVGGVVLPVNGYTYVAAAKELVLSDIEKIEVVLEYEEIPAAKYNVICDRYSSATPESQEAGETVALSFSNTNVAAGYEIIGATMNGTKIADADFNKSALTATFTMPAKDARIETVLGLKSKTVEYTCATDGIADAAAYAKTGIATATVNDNLIFTVANKEADGKVIESVKVNDETVTSDGYNFVVPAKKYVLDGESKITVSVTYKNAEIVKYAITHDEYTSIGDNKTEVPAKDKITVSANTSANVPAGYKITGFKANNQTVSKNASDAYEFEMP
ncbi:MAG: hypothetical protein MJZ66_06950, partial [Bacteroidales bacterium]|nr:hypothetical protein [Bacteroidales bacterium]